VQVRILSHLPVCILVMKISFLMGISRADRVLLWGMGGLYVKIDVFVYKGLATPHFLKNVVVVVKNQTIPL